MNIFEFGVGAHPAITLQSRAKREGIYAGKRSGKHHRISRAFRDEFPLIYPFGMQVRAVNRKQMKQEKAAVQIDE